MADTEKTRCLHCDQWGCKRCLPRGGEQSLDVDEWREIRLRNRIDDLELALRNALSLAMEKDGETGWYERYQALCAVLEARPARE